MFKKYDLSELLKSNPTSLNRDSCIYGPLTKYLSIKGKHIPSINYGKLSRIYSMCWLMGILKKHGNQNRRQGHSSNEDVIKSINPRLHNLDEEIGFMKLGIYPSRDVAFSEVLHHKEGGSMKLNMNGTLSGYTDLYNLSCINSIYPISLTQNELVNYPVEQEKDLLDAVNEVFANFYMKKLTKTEMIDHTLYHNNIMCLILNKTYGVDKKKVGDKEVECLSALLMGFCVYEGLTEHTNIISKICCIIEEFVKDANLSSNTALKYTSDINLSDDNIQILIGKSGRFSIEDLTIKNQEISSLDTGYYPYLDVDALTEEFYNSNDKLLILHGNPGVGKSKLSSLISHRFGQEFKHSVIMFPGRHCMEPDAWCEIEETVEVNSRNGSNTLIIIDDLDPVLLNRDQPELINGNTFFNSLLTILDGVISQGVKFIITTNHVIKKEDDSPLYRPGRLFDSILLKPLNLEEALALLKKYKVSAQRVAEFKKLNQTEYQQSFVAQFINDTNKNIKRSYYKGANKQVTKTKASKIGF